MFNDLIYALAVSIFRYLKWYTDPYTYVMMAARVFYAIGFYPGYNHMLFLLKQRADELQQKLHPGKKFVMKQF
jgi:hypothetical protein